MYALIHTIRIFREYSLESSKKAIVLVESRQQSTIPLPGRDVKTSNSSLEVGFQTIKKDLFWKLVKRSILLGGGFPFTFNLFRHYSSPRAQYVLSILNECGTCLKNMD